MLEKMTQITNHFPCLTCTRMAADRCKRIHLSSPVSPSPGIYFLTWGLVLNRMEKKCKIKEKGEARTV